MNHICTFLSPKEKGKKSKSSRKEKKDLTEKDRYVREKFPEYAMRAETLAGELGIEMAEGTLGVRHAKHKAPKYLSDFEANGAEIRSGHVPLEQKEGRDGEITMSKNQLFQYAG